MVVGATAGLQSEGSSLSYMYSLHATSHQRVTYIFSRYASSDSHGGIEVEMRAPGLDPRDENLLQMFVNMPSKVPGRNIGVNMDAGKVAETPDGKLFLI